MARYSAVRRRLHLCALGLAASFFVAPTWAQADNWPSRPITMIVPFPPGSSPILGANARRPPWHRSLVSPS